MPREFSRGKRIADLIQQELSRLIRQEVGDPRIGMVTITEVKVSRDLAYADVYFTMLGQDDAGAAEASLNQAAGFLRTHLAKTMSTRITPRLRFHHDYSIEEGAHMAKVIDDARKRDRPLDDSDDETQEEQRDNE
jgi:ribosome-binding factor A